MNEYVDMLLEGSHRKTTDELHAFTRASRRRLRLRNEVNARRKRIAESISGHFRKKPYLEDL
jgi:hypothetical protein